MLLSYDVFPPSCLDLDGSSVARSFIYGIYDILMYQLAICFNYNVSFGL